jgi:hypothetical protein
MCLQLFGSVSFAPAVALHLQDRLAISPFLSVALRYFPPNLFLKPDLPLLYQTLDLSLLDAP